MKALKRALRNFFGTTRAQTNGLILTLLIMIVCIFSQPLTRWWISSRPRDFSQEQAELDSLLAHWQTASDSLFPDGKNSYLPVIAYSDFDPNTASKTELMLLGFTEKLATRIINYRNKGGKFRIKTDLLKLYGMDSVLYTALDPYIMLPEKYEYKSYEKKPFSKPEVTAKEKPVAFNLNEADTTQLQKIYGIGSVLAKRIVKYRNQLGGFVSQQQLGEVYGLDTLVIKKIMAASYLPDSPTIQKINLNTADEKTFAGHPYLTKKMAAALVAYRFQHGKFQSVEDLTKLNLIDNRTLAKILPYVTVDP